MEVLVTVETILLVLLALLVAGLLRSHAEILRRLEDGGGSAAEESSQAELPPIRSQSTPAFDIAGTTLAGEPVKVGARNGTNTLLAFLTSGCNSCVPLWQGLELSVRPRIAGDPRIVVVTKDSSHESPSRLRELAPGGVTIVMSSEAWDLYGVQGSPYFIYVDGESGRIRGEGTATAWPQVASLIRDAFYDAEVATSGGGAGDASPDPARRRPTRGLERAQRAADELRAAGIGPGHPSLYGVSDEGNGRGQADG